MNTIISSLLLSLGFFLASTNVTASVESSLISCQNTSNSALKTMLVVIGDDHLLKQIGHIAGFDLAFTDQLTINTKEYDEVLSKKVLKKFFTEDYALCVQLKLLKKKKDVATVAVNVKDTETGATVFEKAFACDAKNLSLDCHKMTAELIPALTGHASIALSSLAYCEQYALGKKSICITDYACFTKKTILKDKSLNIAPSWHSKDDFIFYSRFTKRNSELRCFNLKNNTARTICSYDGINMQPSCSPDGSQVVLSMSGKRSNTELYLYDQAICKKLGKRVFKQLTSNGGSNVSPCLMPSGNVVFCSDFETGSPQIYLLETKNNEIKRVTNKEGYCAGPSYHEKTNSIVYTRLLDGNFQLFSICLSDKQPRERQLTNSSGDKLDPSWSPCGRYIAFTYDYVDATTKKRVPQIAVLNYHSGTIRIMTKDPVPKSFVTWTDRTYYQA